MFFKPVFILLLIVTIMGFWGSSSINMDGMRKSLDKKSLVTAMHSLKIAESNYTGQFNKLLPLVDWRSSLRRMGAQVPNLAGLEIQYGNTVGNGRFFCFQAIVPSQYTVDVIERSRPQLDGYENYINENCGATEDAAGPVADLDSVSLTVYTGV